MIEILGGPNPIVSGCQSVVIGSPVPPIECFEYKTKDADGRVPFRWTKIEFGNVKGKIYFGVNLYGPYARFEGDVELIHLYGETPLEFISGCLKIDYEAILGKAHVEVKVSKPWFGPPEFSPDVSDFERMEVSRPKIDHDPLCE